MSILSTGALDQIMSNQNVDQPVLQLLSYKRLPGTYLVSDWYRLVVSDGLKINQYTMLSTDLNYLFETGYLTKYTIFKVLNYKVRSTHDEKQALIIMDCEKLIPGTLVLHIIDNPTTNVFEAVTDNSHLSTAVLDKMMEDMAQPSTSRDTNTSLYEMLISDNEVLCAMEKPTNEFESKTKEPHSSTKVYYEDMAQPSTSRDTNTSSYEMLISDNEVLRAMEKPTNEFEPKTKKPRSSTMVHNEEMCVENTTQPNISRSANIPSYEKPVVPIATLRPGRHSQSLIKARVSNKSPLKNWSRGKGKLFSMHLSDESDTIRSAVTSENKYDEFYDQIQEGEVYYISNYKVQEANSQYNRLKNKYEVIIFDCTKVEPCHHDANIPSTRFHFCPINQVKNKQQYDKIDVLGVVVKSNDVNQIRDKSVKTIDIVDDSQPDGAKVRVIFWDEQAKKFDWSSDTILAIKGARVNEINEKKSSIISSSVIERNPDLPEAHKLRRWYNNDYLRNSVFTVMAVIDSIDSSNPFYIGCPQNGCGQELVNLPSKKFRCDKCKQDYQNFKYCLRLKIDISTDRNRYRVTAFNEVAEKILNISSQELSKLKENNHVAYMVKMKYPVFRTCEFSLEADITQDEKRINYICVSAKPQYYNN